MMCLGKGDLVGNCQEHFDDRLWSNAASQEAWNGRGILDEEMEVMVEV